MRIFLCTALLTAAIAAASEQLPVPPMPPNFRPLFDEPMRDPCICLAKGTYYLIGTRGVPNFWYVNEGIRIWRSKDLKTWEPLGLVWSFEKDASWQKEFKEEKRAIWAPELHYFKKTFWIPYSINWPGGGTGILRSVSGKPEGPYQDVRPEGPLTPGIDASLFRDDDGTVYFLYQNGQLARMNEEMTNLAEEPRLLKPANAEHVGFEGAFLFKAKGRYYLSCADLIGPKDDLQYHGLIASAPSLKGPWSERYIAIPNGGHNMYFKDRRGRWYSTFFGSEAHAPFTERPAILRITFDKQGRIAPMLPKQK